MGHAQHRPRASPQALRRHHRRQAAPDGRLRIAGKVLRRPDEWPFDRFSVIERDWEGRTVVLVAGGPSLTPEQLLPVRAARERDDIRVVVVNDSYRLAPFADILYFADSRWWQWHKEKPEFKSFAGLKCTIENTGAEIDDDEVHMVRNAAMVRYGNHNFGDMQQGGLSKWSNALRTGGNGGFQVLNLAVLAGAIKIILLGYDMHFERLPGKDKFKSHWHGGHPDQQIDDTNYRVSFTKHFEQFPTPAGVEIRNATPGSNIKRWGFTPIEEALT